ncbi:hypothetical protein EVJ50_09255 [Synechococcus sp. RSCCF101]|uniref:hypothetical protein n=1 Tax=Synechococcus sp. RSCCF101 TaxID=2511069 RepID=UPI001246DB00|nr:hypothetical protein [Synechococcus sp. RSCCF101]QEY32376.1 hypothetical protein EVJ50_09255 [Synechococcus sp. RSCCF101]
MLQQQNIGYYALSYFTGIDNDALRSKKTPHANTSKHIALLIYKLYLNRQGYSKEDGLERMAKAEKFLRERNPGFLTKFKSHQWMGGEWWMSTLDLNAHLALLKDHPSVFNQHSGESQVSFAKQVKKGQSLTGVTDDEYSEIVSYLDRCVIS